MTVNGTVLPAAIVVGNVIPPKEYPEPFQLAEDIVTLAPPALSVPFWEWLVPTTRLPKLIDAGVTESCVVAGGLLLVEAGAVLPPPQEALRAIARLAISAHMGLPQTNLRVILPLSAD